LRRITIAEMKEEPESENEKAGRELVTIHG
jgi:hypothetical protein